jgi:hypothetical protein
LCFNFNSHKPAVDETLRKGILMIRLLTVALAMCFVTFAVGAEQTPFISQVGDVFQIVLQSESSQKTSNGSGSSSDRNTLVERVTGADVDGLELEYDLPKSTTAEERARNWQFPVKVLKPVHGQMQLLDRTELEARIEAWLKLGNLPRSACGRWIFTWTAIRIECDPQSVIQSLAPFDLRPEELRDGGVYQDSRAIAPVHFNEKGMGSQGSTFIAEMIIDPAVVHRERAQADVAVAEMTGKQLTLEAALQARATEKISGNITISFDTDQAGQVQRKTKVTKIEISGADGQTETQANTETVERRLLVE